MFPFVLPLLLPLLTPYGMPSSLGRDDPDASPIARLLEQLKRGERSIPHREPTGHLAGLLAALEIDPASQMLVFSKTSLQATWITPSRPRALYFDDETYVGFIPGAPVLEIATIGKDGLTAFYTLEQRAQERVLPRRDASCVSCHDSQTTRDLPGQVVRSVFPDASGTPILRAGSHRIDTTSPLEQRWGGWFVTGDERLGDHLGNRVLPAGVVDDREHWIQPADLKPIEPPDLESLGYLAKTSDVLALLVFEHQTRTQNLLAIAARATLEARRHREVMQQHFTREELDAAFSLRVSQPAEEALEALLFCEEERLRGRIDDETPFAQSFGKRARRDGRGRSLRDFHLRGRIFKYPLSYLVQTRGFDRLPHELRERLGTRLHEILTGRDRDPRFSHLTENARQAILEIVRETKPGFLRASQ